MASFPKMQLTAKGIALLTKVQDGTQLKYIKVKIGSGKLDGEPISPLTDLIAVNAVMTDLTGEKVGNNTFKIGCYFDNSTITKGFTWREIGIFALDPQEGEVLYAYSNAGDAGDYIPVATDKRIEKYLYTYVSISNAENITVETQGSEIFITKPVLDSAMDTKVTKIDGKGLSTNDYTNEDKEKLSTLTNYDDSGLRQELSAKADKTTVYTKQETDTQLSEKTGINATATYTNNAVTINAPVSAQQIIFIAPSDFSESDTYNLNGTQITITDLNNEPLSNAWKQGSPVQLILKGNKAFFKSGGGANDTLPPQIRSFAISSGNTELKLSWLRPSDTSAYEGLTIVRKVGSAPTKISDGTKIELSKTTTSYTDTGLTNDTKYYYRSFPYNAKKQYQTELTGAVVSGTPKAFSLPTYTGQHSIFGDINEGRIEMYTSGTLTLSPATYDIFTVGGGGGGNGATYESKENGGGGGGYTNTIKAYTVTSNTELSVLVGSGGIGGSSGNSTKPTNGNNSGVVSLAAIGGKAPVGNGKGGDGGSGGGGSGDISIGGSDGNDGQGNYFGIGQHSTTKSFGESIGILYAGGGGHTGGAGGGGNGSYPHGQNGNTHTGGGGGGGYGDSRHIGIGGNGGSGIVIVRWKNI